MINGQFRLSEIFSGLCVISVQKALIVRNQKDFLFGRIFGCIDRSAVRMEVLTKRLKNVKQRGVVMRPGQSLISLYNERSVLYEKYADITIDEKDNTMEEVVADLIAALK